MSASDVNPDRTGIQMEVLKNVMQALNSHPRLRQIFINPVSASLVVVADGNDLRIEEAGGVPLSEQQKQEFVGILDQVFAQYGAV